MFYRVPETRRDAPGCTLMPPNAPGRPHPPQKRQRGAKIVVRDDSNRPRMPLNAPKRPRKNTIRENEPTVAHSGAVRGMAAWCGGNGIRRHASMPADSPAGVLATVAGSRMENVAPPLELLVAHSVPP